MHKWYNIHISLILTAPQGANPRKDKAFMNLNLPNKLTVIRMVLIPFFIAGMILSEYFGSKSGNGINVFVLLSLLVFIIASVTDWFDGMIARKKNLITTFGKFLDPLADKMLVMSALVLFAARGPKWVDAVAVLLILAREFMVSAVRLVVANEGVVVPAGILGKIKTAFTMLVIVVIMLLEGLGIDIFILNEILIWIAAVLTVVSGIQYVAAYWDVIDSNK